MRKRRVEENQNMGVKIGCHIPAAGGYTAMVERALSIGADTFQYFTRNPRGGAVRAYDEADMRQALQKMRAGNIEVVVGARALHAQSLRNSCARPGIRAIRVSR